MSYTKLRYHIITTTQGRRPDLTQEVAPYAYSVMRNEADKLDSKIMLLGGIEDHVHMIASIHPTVAVADFVRDIKKQTTKAIKKRFSHLDDFSWCIDYGCSTVSPFDTQGLEAYIENQRHHHDTNTLRPNYERIDTKPPTHETIEATNGRPIDAPHNARPEGA